MVDQNRNPWRNFIIDMDGVLWRGETPMPGLAAFFDALRSREIPFVLATNNATKVASQYSQKLARFGVAVPPEAILTSAEATASYLRQHYPDAVAYVLGEEGLRQALQRQKITLLNGETESGFADPAAQADLVVVGFTRHACYPQLASAVLLINRGAQLVGTNPDVTFPHEVGELPGAGAYLAFLQAATGATPTIVGKPGRVIFEEALKRMGATAAGTVMVGDRLETDIVGAKEAGLQSVLLLSGVTSRDELEESTIQPDLVLPDLEQLTQYIIAQKDHVFTSDLR